MKEEKSLAKPTASGELVDFKVFTTSEQQVTELIQQNFGPAGLSAFDMDRIKIPTGGMTIWQAPTLTGTENVNAIEGILVHFKDVRAYWPDSYGGGNTPPSCSSEDGQVGVGDPGGQCSACKFALFGSADKGGGQKCKQSRLLFLLRPADLMPVVIPLPPTSLKNCRNYFYRLSSKALQFQDVVTRLTLVKTKNQDGIDYSRCELNAARLLTEDEIKKIRNAAMAMRKAFATVTLQHDDVKDAHV